MIPVHNQRHGFLAAGQFVSEYAPDCRSDGDGAGFFNTSHGHTQVLGFDYDHGAQRGQGFNQVIGYLFGQPFLDLKPPGQGIHQVGDAVQPHDSALVGDVDDAGGPGKRKKMMFADGIDWDILQNDHFIMFFLGEQFGKFIRVLMGAGENFQKHVGGSLGGFFQPG